MNEEKKCRHIWAHEIWACGKDLNDRRRYPAMLYKNKETVSCCGEMITKIQWECLPAKAEKVYYDDFIRERKTARANSQFTNK